MQDMMAEGKLRLGSLLLEAIQGLDFKHLWDEENICLQIGSSDQWDLITEGIDCLKNLTGGCLLQTTPP